MTKTSGLGMGLYVDGIDISGDIAAIDRISGGPALIRQTAINQNAEARIGGVRTGGIEAVAYHNPSAGAAHPTLNTLPRTDRIFTVTIGSTVGDPAACVVTKQIGYDPTRTADGGLLFKVAAESNAYGLEWSTLATALPRTDSAATNGSGIDNGASTAFGLQAYLHVLAFTGTSVTVKLQHSSDNGGVDPFADITGGAFTAATAAGAQRIATAAGLTIKRYLRVITTGTFSNAQFFVGMVRNSLAVTF